MVRENEKSVFWLGISIITVLALSLAMRASFGGPNPVLVALLLLGIFLGSTLVVGAVKIFCYRAWFGSAPLESQITLFALSAAEISLCALAAIYFGLEQTPIIALAWLAEILLGPVLLRAFDEIRHPSLYRNLTFSVVASLGLPSLGLMFYFMNWAFAPN